MEEHGDLAHVSSKVVEGLGGHVWDFFLISAVDRHRGDISGATSLQNLTTTVVQVGPHLQQLDLADSTQNEIWLPPLLFDCLRYGWKLAHGQHNDVGKLRRTELQESMEIDNQGVLCQIAPNPFSPSHCFLGDESPEEIFSRGLWKMQKLTRIVNLPPNAFIALKYLYPRHPANTGAKTHISDELERDVRRALAGRVIVRWTLCVLPILATKDVVLAIVQDIQLSDDSPRSDRGINERIGYRVGSLLDSFALEIHNTAAQDASDTCGDMSPKIWRQRQVDECPGYESIVGSLLTLLRNTPFSPTGILVTGCSGVGKTRLVSCAVARLPPEDLSLHWVSLRDILMQSSWAGEEVLLQSLMPQQTEKRVLLVLDDMDAITGGDGESAHWDIERKLVRNSVIQVIDKLAASRTGIVVGVGESSSGLPTEIVKIGRLEKEISVTPPTQEQREYILDALLQDAYISPENRSRWAPLLASATPGCVAADLRRLCVDAVTRAHANASVESESTDGPVTPSWENFRQAAQTCVPSQLSALDVTKPKNFHENDKQSDGDWSRIHAKSWKEFAGYESVKKRLYRTVVVPWRRCLAEGDRSSTSHASHITPPSGVLFHGPSGVGKTKAAYCLGSSLALPMINVRAADVLDKWLGGSEAAIRSLFARARAAAPCILFLDEIDAIASNRSEDGETADVMSRLLSTLLNEMDGVSSQKSSVLVIACTNRLESLDTALLRPGRLEEHIELSKPSVADALQILLSGFGRAKVDESFDVQSTARRLVDAQANGAEIEGVGREAVLRWIRHSSSVSPVTQEHIEEAIAALHLQ